LVRLLFEVEDTCVLQGLPKFIFEEINEYYKPRRDVPKIFEEEYMRRLLECDRKGRFD
jgi:hypothetical protein